MRFERATARGITHDSFLSSTTCPASEVEGEEGVHVEIQRSMLRGGKEKRYKSQKERAKQSPPPPFLPLPHIRLPSLILFTLSSPIAARA